MSAGSVRTSSSTLPAGPDLFLGRDRELALVMDAASAPTATVVITAAGWGGGVGTTALALRAAQRLADRCPDGQLFLDLQGFTPGMEPVAQDEIVERLLRLAAVAGDRIPAGSTQQVAVWRDVIGRRRLLVVLDNVATTDQVAALLPAAAAGVILVTGQRPLPDLPATAAVSLEPLAAGAAVELFASKAGRELPVDRTVAVEVVELCGRLPLDVGVAAALWRTQPGWSVSDVLAALRDRATTGDVRVAIEAACHGLDPEQYHMYLSLGEHPGPDLTPPVAAALADTTVAEAGRLVGRLVACGLLHQRSPGRYGFHDVVRTHAGAEARLRSQAARHGSLDRLLEHYRQGASAAMDAAHPYEGDRRPRVPNSGPATLDLADPQQAFAWLDAELPGILAAARVAAACGRFALVQDLAGILHRHLRNRGWYRDAEALHTMTLTGARDGGGDALELQALLGLGDILRLQGRHEQALVHLQRALAVARGAGDTAAELAALRGLGAVHRRQGRSDAAIEDFQQQLAVARRSGERAAELHALNGLGDVNRRLGRYEQSAEAFRDVLRIVSRAEPGTVHLNALNGLGDIDCRLGRYEDAVVTFQRALRLARDTSHRPAELSALKGMADVHRRRGCHREAEDHYRRVLALARDSGDRMWQFEALHGLGLLYQATDRPGEALDHHRRALEVAVRLAEPAAQASAHAGVAWAHRALRQPMQARRHWRDALDILNHLGVDITEDGQVGRGAIAAELAPDAS